MGISIPTVQRWVDAGRLKAWKTPGGHRRIDAASADALFAAQGLEASAPGLEAEPADRLLSVMVVDDSALDRELLAALVTDALPGAELSVFDSAIQALVAIGQAAPDIVITDIRMPDMNGLEMLRQLASQCVVRPRLIVAVSSLTPRQVAELGGLPPEVHYFAKPVQAGPFIAALRAVA
ncbi:MAG: response regulator [Burkholderiales bacterium]|nr:response regulator [Burkholderiales bacterium]